MSNRFDLIDALEPRRLMAVDLTPSFVFSGGTNFIGSTNTDQTVTFTVTNSGSSNATLPVGVQLFASTDRKYSPDTDIDVADGIILEGVRAGRRATVEANFSMPETPGRYFLIAVVDLAMIYNQPGGQNNDSNLDNNYLSTRRPVVTSVPALSSSNVSGTSASDKIGIIFSGDQLVLGLNGTLYADRATNYSQLTVSAGAGNDRVACNVDMSVPLSINGGTGTDRLAGGAGNDTIDGSDGSDMLFGGAGDDVLIGGGGNNRFFGGPGRDSMTGGSGTDKFYDLDGSIDTMIGGTGDDQAQHDAGDILTSVEISL